MFWISLDHHHHHRRRRRHHRNHACCVCVSDYLACTITNTSQETPINPHPEGNGVDHPDVFGMPMAYAMLCFLVISAVLGLAFRAISHPRVRTFIRNALSSRLALQANEDTES